MAPGDRPDSIDESDFQQWLDKVWNNEQSGEGSSSDNYLSLCLLRGFSGVQKDGVDIPQTEETAYEGRWDAATYVTALTTLSGNTFHTAVAGTDYETKATGTRLKATDKYAKLLQTKSLWPVDATTELDWSGRGQHAEFQKTERKLIGEILEVHDTLGLTSTAKVESVKCRRILLARKTIMCNRWLKKEQAIQEVAHLSRLSHAHILRVIGTYVTGNELSILLYPVANYNLDAFLESIRNGRGVQQDYMLLACVQFFPCLCDAVSYIHSRMTKHMDIKPQNILVRRNRSSSTGLMFEVYVADFGIARSYDKAEEIMTDGWTSFTRKYAAPEVVQQQSRGLAADIFSLGCIFLEMDITICEIIASDEPWPNEFMGLMFPRIVGREYLAYWTRLQNEPEANEHWTRLQNILEANEHRDNSYHASIDTLQEFHGEVANAFKLSFAGHLCLNEEQSLIICRMISRDPGLRPTAEELSLKFKKLPCCGRGPCKLEAFVDEVTLPSSRASGGYK